MIAFGGTSAVSKYLREIYEDNGGELTAPILVETAKEETHPLHPFFEWDDAIGGHKNRLSQARALIRSSKITFKDKDGVQRQINEYQSVIVRGKHPKGSPLAEERKRVYRATETVAKDVVSREALAAQFRLEWTAFRRRWETFDEFVKMFGNGKSLPK